MKSPISDQPARKHLSDDQYNMCWQQVKLFVQERGSIRNRQVRELAAIGYDQAIDFFNRALGERRLLRKGKSSGTHYVFPKFQK